MSASCVRDAVGRQVERDHRRASRRVQYEHARRPAHECSNLENFRRPKQSRGGAEDEQLIQPRAALRGQRQWQFDTIVSGSDSPSFVIQELGWVASGQAVPHHLVVVLDRVRPIFTGPLSVFDREADTAEVCEFDRIDKDRKAHECRWREQRTFRGFA